MGQRWLDSPTSQPRRCRVLAWLEEKPLLFCTILDRPVAGIVLAVLYSTNYLYRLGAEGEENNLSPGVDLRCDRGQCRNTSLHAEFLDHVCLEKEEEAKVEIDWKRCANGRCLCHLLR